MKYRWRCELIYVLSHFRNDIYDVYKNGFVHNTTMCLNSWMISWKFIWNTIKRIVEKFDSVENQWTKKYGCSGRSHQIVDIVRESVDEDPKIHSEMTTWHIIQKDFPLKTYNNYRMELHFILQLVELFVTKIIWLFYFSLCAT